VHNLSSLEFSISSEQLKVDIDTRTHINFENSIIRFSQILNELLDMRTWVNLFNSAASHKELKWKLNKNFVIFWLGQHTNELYTFFLCNKHTKQTFSLFLNLSGVVINGSFKNHKKIAKIASSFLFLLPSRQAS
jgi:hypothetical protein